MFVGIGFVALITAFIADRFVKAHRPDDEILAELREINERLDRLEARRD